MPWMKELERIAYVYVQHIVPPVYPGLYLSTVECSIITSCRKQVKLRMYIVQCTILHGMAKPLSRQQRLYYKEA
jgi:hypothetical protein